MYYIVFSVVWQVEGLKQNIHSEVSGWHIFNPEVAVCSAACLPSQPIE